MSMLLIHCWISITYVKCYIYLVDMVKSNIVEFYTIDQFFKNIYESLP